MAAQRSTYRAPAYLAHLASVLAAPDGSHAARVLAGWIGRETRAAEVVVWLPSDDERILVCAGAWSRRHEVSAERPVSPDRVDLVDDDALRRAHEIGEPVSDGAKGAGLATSGTRVCVPFELSDDRRGVVDLTLPVDAERGLQRAAHMAPVVGIAVEHIRADDDLRSREERFRSLVEGAAEGIVSVDEAGHICYANDAAGALLGYERDELIGLAVTRLLPPPLSDVDPARIPALMRRAATAMHGHPYDLVACRKDDTEIPLELTLTMRHNDGWAYTAVVRDITERKRTELEMARALRIERRAIRRLESLDRMRVTLLRAVSHELTDPISAIRGTSGVLQADVEGNATLSSADRRGAVERLSSAAASMVALVNDLLNVDRLDAGLVAPRREAVAIDALVASVIESMPAVAGRDVVTDLEHVVVDVDEAQVATIVRNLVKNAAQYSPREAALHVSLHRASRGVMLSVSDRGPGVPARYRHVIFQPFRRGPGSPGAGMGIGLSLVARFARAHGGRAWVEDRPGGGAVFHVLLRDAPPKRRR